jgi:hypothetical protein
MNNILIAQKTELNGILWKIRDYGACLKNAANLPVAKIYTTDFFGSTFYVHLHTKMQVVFKVNVFRYKKL